MDAVTENAARLDLTWDLRPATIAAGNSAASTVAIAIIDNDDNPIPVFSLVGALFEGDRVMTLSVQPEGVYVISMLGFGGSTLPEDQSTGNVAGTQSATGAYASLVDGAATPLAVSFTKQRDGTRICATLEGQAFISGATLNKGQWGVLINGTDYDIVPYFFNTSSDHRAFGGFRHISGIPAGSYSAVIRWKQLSGGGTLSANADDAYFLRIQETR